MFNKSNVKHIHKNVFFDLGDFLFQAIDIISSHPEHDVIIGINTLGKEDLLLQIASVLDIMVFNSLSSHYYARTFLCDI